MAHVQAVAGAGVIHVVARIVGNQLVISRIVDAAEAEHGAELIAFGRVVVDHVEDYLDAFAVQSLHHGFELGDLRALIARGTILRFRAEVVQRVVAPVIAKAAID